MMSGRLKARVELEVQSTWAAYENRLRGDTRVECKAGTKVSSQDSGRHPGTPDICRVEGAHLCLMLDDYKVLFVEL